MRHRIHKGRITALLVLLLTLGVIVASVVAQPEPPLQIDLGRPNPSQDRHPGDPIIAPGEDIFTVRVSLAGGDCPTVVRTAPVDVVVLIDVSTSMDDPAGDSNVSRIQAAHEAAGQFIKLFNLAAPEPKYDQIALVAFSEDAIILTDSTPNQPDVADTALRHSLSDLQNGLNKIQNTIGGTRIDKGLQTARAILDGRSRNLPGGSTAAVVVLTDGDRIDNPDQVIEQANLLRSQLQARVVTIAFGEAVDRNLMEKVASPGNAYTAINLNDLTQAYNDIANRIQPSVAAQDINLTFKVNTANYELRPDTINPPPISVNGNIITWPALNSLDRGNNVDYTFEVRALQPGNAPVGEASSTYKACQQPDVLTIAPTAGPVIQAALPTPTPTPTSTPTPSNTPTPTITPTASPPAFTNQVNNSTVAPLPGVTGALCSGGWWDWLPWIGALLVLLLALWLIRRWWRKFHETIPDPDWRDWLCFLLRAGLALYTVLLVFLFLRPVAGSICEIPESVYFWRLDGNHNGIFVTNNNVDPNANPAQVTDLQQSDCVGCHVVGQQLGPIAAISAPPVPGKMIGMTLDGQPIAMPNLDAVYIAISPDGQNFAVTTGDANLYVVPVGGAPRQLTGASDTTYGALMPAWANNQEIAYVRIPRNQIQYGLVAYYNSEIDLIDSSGSSAPQPLIFSERTNSKPGLNYYPSFSPDGHWLAFTRNENPAGNSYAAPEADIWLLNLRSLATEPNAQAVPIAANAPNASDSWSSWNRNGTLLAFNTTRFDPSYDIVVTTVNDNGSTTPPQRLAGASQAGVFEHLPAWGPPPKRVSLFENWKNLLVPWLFPIFLIWLALVLMCMFFKRKNKLEDISKDPELPHYQPVQPLRSIPLPSWKGIDSLWTPQPALVIGVGSAGWHTLAQLKKTLTDAGLGTRSDKVRLLCIVAGDEKNLIDETFSGIPLEDHEVIHWSDSLQSLVDNSRNDDALKNWINARYLEQYTQAALNPRYGFQNNRVLGRLALINNVRGNTQETKKSVWNELRSAVQNVRDGRTLNVIVVSDLSDDVGSGAVFDLAYMVRQLQRDTLLEITTIRLIGHLFTHRATRGRNIDDLQRPVNNAAAIRELARFQLAGGAAFPMRYSANENAPNELDGETRRMLFDELYVHDGERSPGPLNIYPAPQGVYPAVADCIALWLDEAAREGALAEWRFGIRDNTNSAQIAERQVMFGGMGIFQYRLPFADLLEDMTTRYARDVLQFLLMADSGDLPVFNAKLVKETLVAGRSDTSALVGAFLREELGTPQLNEQWRRLLQGILNDNPQGRSKALRNLRVDAEIDNKFWMAWLRQTLLVILNGRQETTDVDIVIKRGAKLSLAKEFLDYLARLLENYATTIASTNTEAGEQLRSFATIARKMHDNLVIAAHGLGIDTPENSLYSYLAARDEANKQQMRNMVNLRTRRYILNDVDGKSLSASWYDEFLINHVREALSQLIWEFEDDKPVLMLQLPPLKIPGQPEQPARQIHFDPQSMKPFENALVELGRYFAQEVRVRKNLSDILLADQLSRNNINRTTEQLMQESGVLLGIGGGGDALARQRDGLIFSANEKLANADVLIANMRTTMRRPEDMKKLETGDPFTLTVARTSDTIPPEAVPSIREDFRQYTAEIYALKGGQTVSVFDAEATAVEYERRLAEIAESPRQFNSLVVTALAGRQQAETYLLSVVAGDWTFNRRTGLTVSTPETGAVELISTQEANQPMSFCALYEGILRFREKVTAETARAIYERYIEDDRIMRIFDEWEQTSGEKWLEDFADDCGEEIVNDLISITRLLIRRVLENA